MNLKSTVVALSLSGFAFAAGETAPAAKPAVVPAASKSAKPAAPAGEKKHDEKKPATDAGVAAPKEDGKKKDDDKKHDEKKEDAKKHDEKKEDGKKHDEKKDDAKKGDEKKAATDAGVATPKADEKKADDKKVESKPAGGAKYTLVAVPAPDKKVERLWKSKCGSCHGADGKAQTEKGKKMKMEDMTLAAWQTSQDDAELKHAVLKGVKEEKNGVKQEMDGYESELKAEEVDALVKYVRYLGAPK